MVGTLGARPKSVGSSKLQSGDWNTPDKSNESQNVECTEVCKDPFNDAGGSPRTVGRTDKKCDRNNDFDNDDAQTDQAAVKS